MTILEDILRRNEEATLSPGKKKKPKIPKSPAREEYSTPYNTKLPAIDERLRKIYRDSGIDLGQGREENDSDLIKPKYKELDYSVDSLSRNFSLNELSKIEIKNSDKIENISNNYNIFENSNLEEKFDNEEIIKNYNIPTMLINNFSKINSSPLGLNLTLTDSASITADNIGEFALPLVEYIHKTQPDYVVASDRGARLLGLAVFRLYNRLYGKFPTADGTIRFRRFSTSNTQKATEQYVQPLADEMLAHKNKPFVLILDDWVCSGGTKKLAQNVFDKLSRGRIKTKFGVLVGRGADVSGHSKQTSGFAGVTDWRDDSSIIGVRYGKDDWGSSGIRAEPVGSKQARDYRIRMYSGIDKLAERIAEEGKEAVLAKH